MKDRTCNATPVDFHESRPAPAPGSIRWRKSSYSNHESACVEVARIDHDTVAFRDSKDPDGHVLAVPFAEALSFITAAGQGDLATRR